MKNIKNKKNKNVYILTLSLIIIIFTFYFLPNIISDKNQIKINKNITIKYLDGIMNQNYFDMVENLSLNNKLTLANYQYKCVKKNSKFSKANKSTNDFIILLNEQVNKIYFKDFKHFEELLLKYEKNDYKNFHKTLIYEKKYFKNKININFYNFIFNVDYTNSQNIEEMKKNISIKSLELTFLNNSLNIENKICLSEFSSVINYKIIDVTSRYSEIIINYNTKIKFTFKIINNKTYIDKINIIDKINLIDDNDESKKLQNNNIKLKSNKELKQELKQEFKQELNYKLKQELKEEIKQEIKREIKRENNNNQDLLNIL